MRPVRLLVLVLLFTATRAAAAELHVTLTDGKGQPVPDAVLTAYRTDGPQPAAAALHGIEITQKDEEFLPFITVVTTGTAVTFPNRDTVQHHVYSLSKAKKFELPLYDPGKAETIVFDQPGIVTIGCNIHDWMLAYLVVVDTPYHALSGRDGVAALALPAGVYRIEVWHPRLIGNPVTLPVRLAEAARVSPAVEMNLKPDRRVRRAPDAKPGGY
ncbi:MAG: methylamine utilization protein [Opitutales bacterium]